MKIEFRIRSWIAALTILGLSSCFVASADAAPPPSWNGSTDNKWTTSANWSNNVPTQFGNASIVFGDAGATNLSTDVNAGGQYFINDLSTSANASSFSISNSAGGANELAIAGNVFINSGAANLAAAINYPVFFNKTQNTTLTFDVDGTGRSLAVKEIHKHTSGTFAQGQSVIKSGTGSMTFSTGGTSTYLGTTTINGGTLAINGTVSTGSGVIVNSTGTLGGTGTANQTITVNAGGTIAPGNSIGTLNTGSLSLAASTAALTTEIDLSNTLAADLLNVTGGVSLSGSMLNLSLLNPSPTQTLPLTFLIVANDLSDAVSGSFATITAPLGSSVSINYAFSSTDALGRIGMGNAIAVTTRSVPEPTAVVLAGCAMAGWFAVA
jgi:hypothetical protein